MFSGIGVGVAGKVIGVAVGMVINTSVIRSSMSLLNSSSDGPQETISESRQNADTSKRIGRLYLNDA